MAQQCLLRNMIQYKFLHCKSLQFAHQYSRQVKIIISISFDNYSMGIMNIAVVYMCNFLSTLKYTPVLYQRMFTIGELHHIGDNSYQCIPCYTFLYTQSTCLMSKARGFMTSCYVNFEGTKEPEYVYEQWLILLTVD